MAKDAKDFQETIKAMKMEIVNILNTSDLSTDKEAQQTIKTIEQMFKRLNKDAKDILPKEMLDDYFQGVDEATSALQAEGMKSAELAGSAKSAFTENGKIREAFKTQAHMEAIEEITDDTMLDMQSAIRTARDNSLDTINDALDSVKESLQSGEIRGSSIDEINKHVAKSFSDNGMISFKTKDGRELPLDFYSETVTRTNKRRANTKGATKRFKENDVELFTLSQNKPTCYECAPYGDTVFTMNPSNDEFPYLDPEEFPKHPNCECVVKPYVQEYKSQEELDADKEASRKFDPDKDNRTKAEKQEYDKQQALHRKNNYEKKRYADIKGLLGDDAPKTLGGFKRMKRSNSDNYKKLLRKYQKGMKS